MWNLVTLTASKFSFYLGGLVMAARIAVGAGGATGVNGAPIYVPDFNTSGVESTSLKVPIEFPFIAYVKGGTGSTTVKYPSSCFPNPLHAIGKGSGTVLSLDYWNGHNPTGVGGDIGLVKGCGDSSGSGSTVILNDVGTASGAEAHYTTGTLDIGDYDFIKFTPRSALAPGFTARITGVVRDNPMR